MRILHINHSDRGGGAEEFALSLCNQQPNAVLLVGKKHTELPFVQELPEKSRAKLFRFLDKVLWKLGLRITFRNLFGFPDHWHGTFKILRQLKAYRKADVVHLHNLHGQFFDLEAIGRIAAEKPVVWTSHDAWLLTGGEGAILPEPDHIKKAYPYQKGFIDARPFYLQLKKKLLQNSRITVIAPSLSHFAALKHIHPEAIVHSIYNGIDLKYFYPDPERPTNSPPRILVFYTSSPYKDSETVMEAVTKVQTKIEIHTIGRTINQPGFDIVQHGHITNREQLSNLFRSIDIAVFSSKAETFGLLPAELAACGAKVFLNASLPVFHEHKELYNAALYDGMDDLVLKLKTAITDRFETRRDGLASAEAVKLKLDRKKRVGEYEALYECVSRH